jgi:hypothetical protein
MSAPSLGIPEEPSRVVNAHLQGFARVDLSEEWHRTGPDRFTEVDLDGLTRLLRASTSLGSAAYESSFSLFSCSW